MRGTLNDQDLTNYALNDGQNPQERLYVESMLGLSEECRGDVYKMMDLGQMLEEGFEMECAHALPELKEEQRAALLCVQPQGNSVAAFLRKSATAMALAACAALVLANPQLWDDNAKTARAINTVSDEVSRIVSAMKPAVEEEYEDWAMPSYTDDETSDFLQASSDSMPTATDETICTPPTWQVDVEATEQPQALP